MVSRIPPAPTGPSGTPAVEGVPVGGAAAPGEVDAAAGAVPSAPPDAVTRIAEDLAGGRITRDQAVERIIAEALDSELIRTAPGELRADVAHALEALLATDPYLQSLVRGLGNPSHGEGR